MDPSPPNGEVCVILVLWYENLVNTNNKIFQWKTSREVNYFWMRVDQFFEQLVFKNIESRRSSSPVGNLWINRMLRYVGRYWYQVWSRSVVRLINFKQLFPLALFGWVTLSLSTTPKLLKCQNQPGVWQIL